MATKFKEIYDELAKPFDEKLEIEWRVGQSGITKDGKIWAQVLPYVTSRAIMERLDKVLGFENWGEEITEVSNGYLHRLTIKLPDGSFVTKCDGADKTEFEPMKGGISNSLKRVAVKLGIGRYLYGLNKRYFAIIRSDEEKGQHRDKVKDKDGKVRWFYWDEPKL